MPTIKERPILFSGDMVCALLAGAKTQTRRIIKPQPDVTEERLRELDAWIDGFTLSQQVDGAWQHGFINAQCPYGEPGNRLWVRETWRKVGAECGCSEAPCGCPKPGDIVYRATQDDGDCKWRPSIHMQRAACRILLEITDVRVEQLQDISEADAIAEGCEAKPCDHKRQSCEDIGCYGPTAAGAFHWLWNQLNGPDSWNANPWVWVIEFKRVEV
ncbi:ASCH domain-containing protein [Chromobacterium piscinae]|uniref:hypothetical protein n=1 Tax=Chromobacterium piscinae TaxID=686831 RepID=UPI001E2EAE36|nr:hypothetical protein [Chromobacterium piscinae]MCD5326717.1 hypothetical protein [Chromobacterium piscinae]